MHVTMDTISGTMDDPRRKCSDGRSNHTKSSYVLYTLMFALMFMSLNGYAHGKEILLGGLFGREQFDADGYVAFRLAIDYVNSRDDVLPNVTLSYVVPQSREFGELEVIQRACTLVQEGPAVVIGPTTTADVKAVSPILSGLHIPHISPAATDPTLSMYTEQFPYLFKMSSPDNFQSLAIFDLIKYYGWSRFGMIASATDYGRNGVTTLQTEALKRDWVITAVLYFQPTCNLASDTLTSMLNQLKNKGTRVVVLNCQAKYARLLLDMAAKLGMLGSGWVWITTDGVTALGNIYDSCAEVPLHLRGLIGTRPLFSAGELYSDFKFSWTNKSAILADGKQSCRNCSTISSSASCPSTLPQANTSDCKEERTNHYTTLVFDAVLAAAYGIHSYLADGHVLQPPRFGPDTCTVSKVIPWQQGQLLAGYISRVSADGSASYINFTSLRYPGTANYEIVNLVDDGWKSVGRWTNQGGHDKLSINDTVSFPGLTRTVPADRDLDLTNVNLRVVTIIEAPFTMEKLGDLSIDDAKYEGYCIDLLNKLQESLKFKYELYLVPDGNYGGKDPVTGHWNGMVGEVVKGNADLVIAPLTINYERDQVVDFTKPYQDLGNIFIMAKESPQQRIFAFMDPFSTRLWLVLGAAFIICGLATTLVSWVSPFGRRGAYSSGLEHARDKYKPDRNTFNLWNSLWHTFSLWMMQGAEVTPKCLSGRLVYGAWYFTVMVISATYTANLAAFLTVQRLDSGINNIQDLADQKDIKYGTVDNTAISQFFKIQVTEPYITMYRFMEQMSSNVPNSSVGLQKVQDSYRKPTHERYAFIYDSIPLEYAANQEPCHITTIGRLFNQFGYGLALQKNSPYLEMFSLEILKLRQSGYLNTLYNKWVLSGTCQADAEASNKKNVAQQATIEQMIGVFLLTSGILVLALVVILFEYCAAAKNDKKKNASQTFCGAFTRRCRLIRRDVRDNVSTCICCQSDSEYGNPANRHQVSTDVKSHDCNSDANRSQFIYDASLVECDKQKNGSSLSRM